MTKKIKEREDDDDNVSIRKIDLYILYAKIIDNVNELTGIETIKILFDRNKARVVFEDSKISEEEILHKIEEIGYSAKKI